MLALIGKLIALGMEGLAVKELRVLKKRLQAAMGKEKASKVKSVEERETLASLLHFPDVDVQSPALALVIAHQMAVLRILVMTKKPSTTEAAIEHLRLSCPSAPANLLLNQAKALGQEARAARQLEGFTKILLDMCPSVSTSEDAIACDRAVSPVPEIVLGFQKLAFEVRMIWWKLSDHRGNEEKELVEPFGKCLAAFARRSWQEPEEKYQTALTLHRELAENTGEKVSFCNEGITRSMSSMAQAARLYSDAIEWTKTNGTARTSESAAQIASVAVRLASLSLSSSTSTDEATVIEALDAMEQVPAGTPSDLDTLLAEVASLRKAAIAVSVGGAKEAQEHALPGSAESQALCYSIVFACARFLGRYLGCSPPETAEAKAILRYGERVIIVKRIAKTFIDSVIVCCKAAMAANDIT